MSLGVQPQGLSFDPRRVAQRRVSPVGSGGVLGKVHESPLIRPEYKVPLQLVDGLHYRVYNRIRHLSMEVLRSDG